MEYLFVNDAASGDVIIQQGDEGDNFYIIDQVQHMQHAEFYVAQARVRQGSARDGKGWPLRRKALKLKTLA